MHRVPSREPREKTSYVICYIIPTIILSIYNFRKWEYLRIFITFGWVALVVLFVLKRTTKKKLDRKKKGLYMTMKKVRDEL